MDKVAKAIWRSTVLVCYVWYRIKYVNTHLHAAGFIRDGLRLVSEEEELYGIK